MNPSKALRVHSARHDNAADGLCINRDKLNRGRQGSEATGQAEGSRGTRPVTAPIDLSPRRRSVPLGNLARLMMGLAAG
jgi:hypothetical protein